MIEKSLLVIIKVLGRLTHHTGWKAGQKVGSSQSRAGAETMAGIAQLRMTPIRMPLPRAAAPIIPATPAWSRSTLLR